MPRPISSISLSGCTLIKTDLKNIFPNLALPSFHPAKKNIFIVTLLILWQISSFLKGGKQYLDTRSIENQIDIIFPRETPREKTDAQKFNILVGKNHEHGGSVRLK